METKFTWSASVETRPHPSVGHWYVVMDSEENGLGEFYGDDHETNVANLNMAAAAPALYEALAGMIADHMAIQCKPWPSYPQALAALALARGETSQPESRVGLDPDAGTRP